MGRTDVERDLKDAKELLEEIAANPAFDGVKTRMGWPIRHQAQNLARKLGDAMIDDIRRHWQV
jgi:hypothetical protein